VRCRPWVRVGGVVVVRKLASLSYAVLVLLLLAAIATACGAAPSPTATVSPSPEIAGTAAEAATVPAASATAVPSATQVATATAVDTAVPATPTAVATASTATPEPTQTATAGSPTTQAMATSASSALPSATPATAAGAGSVTPDAATGAALWPTLPCQGCHGDVAQGGRGPRLAGTGLSFDQVLLMVRSGKGIMPAFTPEQVSDDQLRGVYAWLESLAPATPTPAAGASAPSLPAQQLLALWQSVNDMKVMSDYTKDLPAREASDDAGRLASLKGYAAQAVQLGQTAVSQANQLLGATDDATMKAILQGIVAATNVVIGEGNQALGAATYADAWPHATQMTLNCRLDAWPLATEAVRQDGIVGTVTVRVTDQSGRPLVGAPITVLTAHTPVGVLSDASGRATIPNCAAVPALQVKAFWPGTIYHEEHVNLGAGQTADLTLALVGAAVAGGSPVLNSAAVQPESGAGDAAVTLTMDATHPGGQSMIADDQVFALCVDCGLAYIPRLTGGSTYTARVTLPGLAPGAHQFIFWVVDHPCDTSGFITEQYTVQ
jgi:mono/diheme cytochrome c family protein